MTIDFYQVWTDDSLLANKAPSAKYLKLNDVDVPLTSSGMDIQEYRIWLWPDEKFQSDSDYIGFASARWQEKFPNTPTIEYILHNVRALSPKGRWMHSLITAQPHWIEHMAHYHRGMLNYILDGASQLGVTPSQLNNQALCMCNSFMCRKDIFWELKEKMKFMYDFYEQKYGHKFEMVDNGYGDRILGCFYERVLMICAASCSNVEFLQPMMNWVWP